MILNEFFYLIQATAAWLSEHSGSMILAFRMTLHLLTMSYLICYVSQERKKFVPTALAVFIGGCSFAAFVQGCVDWDKLVFNTQPWVMGLTLSLTIICAQSKGNMSRPLRFIWR